MMDQLSFASPEFVTVQILPKTITGLTNEKLLPPAGLSALRVANLLTVVDQLDPTQREAFAHKAAQKMGKAFDPAFKKDRLKPYVSEKVYGPLKTNLSPEIVDALRTEILKPTNNNLSILTAFLCAPEQNQANSRVRLWNTMLKTLTQAALDQGILTMEDLKKGDLFLSEALSQSYPLLFPSEGYQGKTVIEAMCDTAGEFLQAPESFKLVSPEPNGRKPVELQRREHTQRLSEWVEEERRNIGFAEGVVNIDKLRDEIKNIGKYKEHELAKPDFGQLALLENASELDKKAAILAIFEPEKGLFYQIPEHRKSIYLLSNIARLCEELPGEYKQLLALALCQEDRGLTTAVPKGKEHTLEISTYDITILRNADPEIKPFVHDFLLELVEKTYGTTNIDPEGKYAHPAVGISNIFLLTHPDKEGLLRLFTLWDQHPDIDHLACLFSDQNSKDETFIPQGLSTFSHVYDRYNPDDPKSMIGNHAIDLLNNQEVSDRFMQHFIKLLNSLTTQEQRKNVATRFLGYAFRETKILPSSNYKAEMLQFWIKHAPRVHIKAGYGSEIFFEWRLEDLCDEHQTKDYSYYYTLDLEKAKRQAAEWKRKSEVDEAISRHLQAGADMRQVIGLQIMLLNQREDFRQWQEEIRREFKRLYDALPVKHKFVSHPDDQREFRELPTKGYDYALRRSLGLGDDVRWNDSDDQYYLYITQDLLSEEQITHQHVTEAMASLHELVDKSFFTALTQPDDKTHTGSQDNWIKWVTKDDLFRLPLAQKQSIAAQLKRVQNFFEAHKDNPIFTSLEENYFKSDDLTKLLQVLMQSDNEIKPGENERKIWDKACNGGRILCNIRAIETRRKDVGVNISTSPDSFRVTGARSYQLYHLIQKYAEFHDPREVLGKIVPVTLPRPLHPGMRVYITGPNGGGKTEAVRAFMSAQYIALQEGTPLASNVVAYVQPGIPKVKLAQAHFGDVTDAGGSLFQHNLRTAVGIAPSGLVGIDEPLVGAPTEFRTPLAYARFLTLGKGGAIVLIPTHEAPDFFLMDCILGKTDYTRTWMINPATHEQMDGIGGSFGIEMAGVAGLPLNVISNAYRVKDGLSANLETIDLAPVKALNIETAERKPVGFISDESLANLGFSGDPAIDDNVIKALIQNAVPQADETAQAALMYRYWPQFRRALQGRQKDNKAIEKAEAMPLADLETGLEQLTSSLASLQSLEMQDTSPKTTSVFDAVKSEISGKNIYGDAKTNLVTHITDAVAESGRFWAIASHHKEHLQKLRQLAPRLDKTSAQGFTEALDRISYTLTIETTASDYLRKQEVSRLNQFLSDHTKLFSKKAVVDDFDTLFKDPKTLQAAGGIAVWEKAKADYQNSNDISGIFGICEKLSDPKNIDKDYIPYNFYLDHPYERIFLAVRSIIADRKLNILISLSQNNKDCIELVNKVLDEMVFSYISAANTRSDSKSRIKFTMAKKPDKASGDFPLAFTEGINMALYNYLRVHQPDTKFRPQSLNPGKVTSEDPSHEFQAGTQILAVTGVNEGGKTQSLRGAGQLAVLGRALNGKVPASEATVADFSYIFAAVNTARTGDGKSTFFNEMHSVLNMYQEFVAAGCPKGALILYDEPANGTSKDEKVALTVAILHSLEQMGATVIFTNHESDVYKAMNKVRTHESPMKYFPVAYQYTNKPGEKYVLHHGLIGGSESAQIALENGMSQEEVALAEFLRRAKHEFQDRFTN